MGWKGEFSSSTSSSSLSLSPPRRPPRHCHLRKYGDLNPGVNGSQTNSVSFLASILSNAWSLIVHSGNVNVFLILGSIKWKTRRQSIETLPHRLCRGEKCILSENLSYIIPSLFTNQLRRTYVAISPNPSDELLISIILKYKIEKKARLVSRTVSKYCNCNWQRTSFCTSY